MSVDFGGVCCVYNAVQAPTAGSTHCRHPRENPVAMKSEVLSEGTRLLKGVRE